MNSKQYYETVDVKEWKPKPEELFPDFSINVPVICADGITKQAYYHFTTRQWYWVQDDKSECNPLNGVTHWLRPVDLSELIENAFNTGWVKGNNNHLLSGKQYLQSLINTTNEQ